MTCVIIRFCSLCMSKHVEMVERKGQREFALCPFQPSVFLCVCSILCPPYLILSLPVKSVCLYSFQINLSLFSDFNNLCFHYLRIRYFVSIFNILVVELFLFYFRRLTIV